MPRLRRRTTAYTFLTVVLPKVILAEPKRMRMGTWISSRYDGEDDEDVYPACGTIGCIGGWTELMTGHNRSAAKVLGIDFVIDPKSQDYLDTILFEDHKLMRSPAQGTLSHAKAVVAHMRRFARKHEKRLRKTILEPYRATR